MSIYVLAGTHGAGKSSIGGAMIRAAGGDYFNPDEAARQIAEANPGASIAEANSAAWLEGKRLLERAIAERGNLAFVTTLGGATMTRLLASAIDAGIDVHMWYVALASPELHLARVKARVSRGGHDIPEREVRRRYDGSRHNLLELLHGLASLRVHDNSADAEPAAGTAPEPALLLHMERGRILHHCELATAPAWAKPILLTAAPGSSRSVIATVGPPHPQLAKPKKLKELSWYPPGRVVRCPDPRRSRHRRSSAVMASAVRRAHRGPTRRQWPAKGTRHAGKVRKSPPSTHAFTSPRRSALPGFRLVPAAPSAIEQASPSATNSSAVVSNAASRQPVPRTTSWGTDTRRTLLDEDLPATNYDIANDGRQDYCHWSVERGKTMPAKRNGNGNGNGNGHGTAKGRVRAQDVQNDHVTKAGEPITYYTAGHPPRSDSPYYIKARKALHQIHGTHDKPFFGPEPIQDHHGGGLWVYDDEGWFFVRNLVGIEWSGQFCADPAKVDLLRQNARRLYAGFPRSFDEFKTLGIDLKELLDTPITDAEGVSRWTDSICNASVPLPQPVHTGTVPKGGGVHNYPTPVTDIAFFKRDDFTLWVVDDEGHDVAVVPTHPPGSGKRDLHVIHSEPGSKLNRLHRSAEARGQGLILQEGEPLHAHLAKQAFAKQSNDAKAKPRRKSGQQPAANPA